MRYLNQYSTILQWEIVVMDGMIVGAIGSVAPGSAVQKYSKATILVRLYFIKYKYFLRK